MSSEGIPAEILFSEGLMEQRYPDFPYPVKQCVYCNKEMTLAKTLHIVASPSDFKAIYVCYNKSCEAFDEPAQRAYLKVYYSSPTAARFLDGIKIGAPQPGKE